MIPGQLANTPASTLVLPAWMPLSRFSRGGAGPNARPTINLHHNAHHNAICDEIITSMKSESENKGPVPEPDASASCASGIGIIVPFTQAALAWLKEHCATESWQWNHDILYVDRRMMEEIVQGMTSANLTVSSEL